MFELLPGRGVRLPEGLGVLRFGASEREAQWLVASLADVREVWVCGAGWSFTASYGGLEISVLGDVVDRADGRVRRGLAEVCLTRCTPWPAEPPGTTVVLADIDLLGHPIHEVEAALAGHGPGGAQGDALAEAFGLSLLRPRPGTPAPAARPGRKPRHPEHPAAEQGAGCASAVRLSLPGRADDRLGEDGAS